MNRKILAPLALAALLLFSPAGGRLALAQQSGPIKTSEVWLLQGRLASPISVTSTPAATQLPIAGFVARVCNTGSVDAYVNVGVSSGATTSTTTGSWLPAGWCWGYDLRAYGVAYTWIAAVTASSTTTLTVETGQGTPPQGVAASGGSGGSVTQGTTPWVDSVTAWGGGTLGAMANYGTSPGAVLVPGVNAFITNAPTVNHNTTPTVANGNGVVVAASATNGASTTGNIAANNTTGVNLKGSAGTVYGVQLGGIGSAPAYLKIYDKATAPTCGTDTPIKRLIIPAASTAANGGGSNVSFGPSGILTTLGIGYCVTTGITDADTTAPAANTFLVNVDWK